MRPLYALENLIVHFQVIWRICVGFDVLTILSTWFLSPSTASVVFVIWVCSAAEKPLRSPKNWKKVFTFSAPFRINLSATKVRHLSSIKQSKRNLINFEQGRIHGPKSLLESRNGKAWRTDRPTDGQTDGRTGRRTDTPSYWVTSSRLKINPIHIF